MKKLLLVFFALFTGSFAFAQESLFQKYRKQIGVTDEQVVKCDSIDAIFWDKAKELRSDSSFGSKEEAEKAVAQAAGARNGGFIKIIGNEKFRKWVKFEAIERKKRIKAMSGN